MEKNKGKFINYDMSKPFRDMCEGTLTQDKEFYDKIINMHKGTDPYKIDGKSEKGSNGAMILRFPDGGEIYLDKSIHIPKETIKKIIDGEISFEDMLAFFKANSGE